MSDFNTIWVQLFGSYNPIQIYDYEGNIQYVTDWGYVSRVVFFIVVVYCVLKMIGGVLTRDRK